VTRRWFRTIGMSIGRVGVFRVRNQDVGRRRVASGSVRTFGMPERAARMRGVRGERFQQFPADPGCRSGGP
jgi:hypothetical protein